jgi:AraC-like DNA-binding protein
MSIRIHQAKQHRSPLPGIEAMTLVSNHHFPRHAHDQFGIGVIASGAQRSWSSIGTVEAGAGDVIMANPGEMHDGVPFEGKPRRWRMIYIEPNLLAREVEQELRGKIEIVHPVAHDLRLAEHFLRFFACLTASPSDGLALEETLLGSLMHMVRQHGTARVASGGTSPTVRKAIRRLDSCADRAVSLGELAVLCGVSRFQLLRGFAREVGITPHAYLVQRRVCLARQFLATGETPAQAAMQAGFADQSHMTRAFVRQLGITPGRYQAAIA